MDINSIGTLLKTTRERLEINLAQVVKDTKISVKWLEALENDRLDEFDSEIYLIGFLKTYAEYLSLDGQQMVEFYRNTRVQEQPTPIKELLTKPSIQPRVILLAILGVVILAICGWLFVLLQQDTDALQRFQSRRRAQQSVQQYSPISYTMVGDYIEHTLYEGDKIQIGNAVILLERIRNNIVLSVNGRNIRVAQKEYRDLDIDGDLVGDVTVSIRDVFGTGVTARAVVMVSAITEAFDNNLNQQANGSVVAVAVPPIEYGITKIASRKRVEQSIGTVPIGQPLVATISFSANSYFQHQSDLMSEASGQLHQAGSTLTIEANDYILLWMSNAGAVTLQIADFNDVLGVAGQIQTLSIERRQSPSENEANSLAIVPLY